MRHVVLAVLFASCAAAPRVVVAPVVPPAPAPVAAWVRPPVPDALEAIARVRPAVVTRSLKNGLRVVVVADHRARLVNLRLFFANGSAAEDDGNAGATSFALGLLGDRFNHHDDTGALKDSMEKSARYLAIVKGAQLRADVSPDVAWLGLDGYSADTARLIQQLDAVVRAQRHGDESFQARSQAAVDLLNELELTDGLVLDQYLSQLAFGSDHAYARSTIGTASSLEHLGLEDVIERQNALLTPVGTTLLVAGDVDPDAVFRQVERSFGSWRGKAPERVRLEAPRVVKRKHVVFLPRKPSRNTLVCLTRPLTDLPAKARAAGQLAVGVVGGLRISSVLRERLGLSYSVSAQVLERRAASAMSVCARVRSTEVSSATRLMFEAFTSLAQNPPTQAEVDTVRAMRITDAETAQDDLAGIVEAWRHAAVMGLPAPPENEVEALRAVSLAQVQAAAKALSARDSLQVILSGERPLAEATAQSNQLGALRVPQLKRVEE